ncbi:MAG: DUF2336 domain-containing protein [Caulobacterales bacterium]
MSIKTMRVALTEADLRMLAQSGDDDDRALAVHKVCRKIDAAELSDAEREHADAILKILSQDAAELVRRALAVTLRNSPKLPRDVAMALANDVENVALHVLSHSPVLTDSDLIQIVRRGSAAKQTAIAKRPVVSRPVSLVISNEASMEAVRALAGNHGAELSESDMETLLVRFPHDQLTAEGLAMRPSLPIAVAEKLVHAVSGAAFDYLVNRHALSPKTAIELANSARERASIDLIAQAGRTENLSAFVHHLNIAGRLTASFILRAACLGYISFVEHAFAELSGVPHRKAWLLLHDAGPLGLRALYERTNLPGRFMPIFRLAIDVFHEADDQNAGLDKDAFSKIMLERILTQAQGLPREDVDYLLEKLDALSGGSGIDLSGPLPDGLVARRA